MPRLFVSAAALLLLAGCASGEEDSVRRVAGWFSESVAAEDMTGACLVLAPETRQQAESAGGGACEAGLVEEGLPASTSPSQADVFGDSARVVLDGDTLFLARFDGKWLVTAAGCSSRGDDRPYSCRLSGG